MVLSTRTRRSVPHRLASLVLPVFVLLAAVGVAAAQDSPDPVVLTLDDAIRLAKRHGPAFRILANDEAAADWRVREAYGLLLPQASAGAALQYQGEGQPLVGSLSLRELGLDRIPATYSSTYSFGLDYSFSPELLARLGEERAQRRATIANVEAAELRLRVDVTRQFLAALGARDAVELARRELESAAENEALARARSRAGAGTELDVKQAEVERGRAEVALLEAEHRARTERLKLMELLGVVLDDEVELHAELEVFAPDWTEEDLIAEALASHPELRSRRAAEAAGRAGERAAKGAFLPTLSLSVNWSGYTRRIGSDEYLLANAHASARSARSSCERMNLISAGLSQPLPDHPVDCSIHDLTPSDEARILAENDVFPFDFTRQPVMAQLRVSIPVFQGFARRRRLEAARAAAEDAREERRAEELARRRSVAEAVLTLETAYRRTVLEERNAAAAAEQLRLARQRYRLGAGTFLELSQAEATKASADRDRLGAIYAFQEALVALEAAVGRRLRPQAGSGQ